MKKFLLILFVVFPSYLFAQHARQTNGANSVLDVFKLSLTDEGGISETINLYIDNRYTKDYDGDNGAEMGFDMGASALPYMFSTIADSAVHGKIIRLTKDKRGKNEYPINFYVDFPLNLENLGIGKQYRFSVTLMAGQPNESAVCFRIVDTYNPEDLHIIWENGTAIAGGWSFTATEPKPAGRFIARVYAGSLWKKDAASTDWSDSANWIGGVPGLSTSNVKHSNCVFIPIGTEVEMKEDVLIYQLMLQGKLTVREGVTLTVENTSLTDIQKAY